MKGWSGRGIGLGGLLCLIALGLLAGPVSAQVAGIEIDAEGVVRAGFMRRESSSLGQKRMQAFAEAQLPENLAAYTPLRKVSLRGLAQALEAAGSADQIPIEVRGLYGLQRLDYIFVDDATGDVVLAGPGEGFAPDAGGRMVGLTTGKPVLHLDDLLAALRWAATSGRRDQIGCSIDPEPIRMQSLQNWVRDNSNPVTRDIAQNRFVTMAQLLGRQNVSVFGVPSDSHFARVLVEADYRMKLIAMGKENPGVPGLRSHVSMIVPQGNSLQRWWFVPLYDPIEVDEAGLAFHLSGQRAQVLAQDEWTDALGRRSDAPFTRATTEKFARQFTERFPALADKSPAFAELQNVFDLAVFAALLERQAWRGKYDIPLAPLYDAERWPLQKHPVPTMIDSMASTTNHPKFILGVVGGVTLTPSRVLAQPWRREKTTELQGLRAQSLSAAPEQRAAWWDE